MSDKTFSSIEGAVQRIRDAARNHHADPVITRVNAAAMLGVSVGTLRRWNAAGNGPKAFKLGGQVRYRLSSVNAFLEAAERNADPEA